VSDARRQQAKRYVLANILLFCILGFLCGAKSYKALCSFIAERFALLQAAFPSKMTRAPAPSTLWRIIGLVDGGTLEAAFRRHAASQHAALGGSPGEVVAHDGKSLKGSYDTANPHFSHVLTSRVPQPQVLQSNQRTTGHLGRSPQKQTVFRPTLPVAFSDP
jgi:hypothetical protein